MKLKTSAIALAVAGAMGASMAAQADSGFYGSIRIGLIYDDKATGGGGVIGAPVAVTSNDEIQVQGVSSRFGFRGETDMGNGLTGFGRYEFGIDTEGDDVLSRRHAYVGLKGGWGSVKLGQTYHTYYGFMVGPLDNPWRGAATGVKTLRPSGTGTTSLATWLNYTGRTAQAITYTGAFGMVEVGATGYMNGSSVSSSGSTDDLDGYELAAAIQAGPIKIALGIQDVGGDETSTDLADRLGGDELQSINLGNSDGSQGFDPEMTVGITASGWQTGIFTWGLGYAQQDGATITGGGGAKTPDASSWIFDVAIGNGYFHYEQTEYDFAGAAKITPTLMTLGYTQSVGRQTTMYYEIYQTDADTNNSNDDKMSVAAVLKYDWK
jgi:predicted porin